MEILLHVCCAPCATTPVTRLLELGHRVSLYFSNHNIDTAAEHDKRLHQVEKLAAHFQTPLLVDERDHEAWRTAVAGLESEPERGERCRVCFNYSLCRTYARLQSAGYDAMTTTLTTSPHKPAALIFGIGAALAEAKFLPLDFKKQDGFARSLQLSRQLNLYRQNYCGCPFSHRPVSTTPHAKQAT